MRFTIYAGDQIIYDPYLASSGRAAISPTLTIELNKSGSLEFTLPPGSIGYNDIPKLKTIIKVYRDDTLLFKGRVINDQRDFYNRKRVYCEGALSFFIDSQMRPYNYKSSVASFLNSVITNHNNHVDNDKRFTVGTVSVTDPIGPRTRESSEYQTTLDVLNNELVDVFGGFLRVRESQGENIIDYIGEYGTTSSQTIEFGKNLLDLTEHISAENIFTVLIPLGEEIQNNDGEVIGRLTIADVNNNKDYLENAVGVNLFGRIEAVSVWDEVGSASALKTLGQNLLENGIESTVKLTIKAVDYRMINQSEASFELGEMVRVISEPHGIDTEFQVTKITYDIANPDQTTYEFGADYHTLTERTVSASKENKNMEGKITKSFNDVLQEAKDNATALINNGIGGHVYVLPDELYIMDTDSIDTATKVWRWNLGGLGYWHGQAGQASSGTYGLAITQDGAIVADYITAGTLNAGVIKAGLLKAYNNEDNWWNLSTGELHVSGDSISIHAGDNIAQYLESTTSTLNLLPSYYYTESRRSNPHVSAGITWTLNPDGSVTATGTASADENSVYSFCGGTKDTDVPVITIDPSKKYTISGCPSGGSVNDYRLGMRLYDTNTAPDNFNNGTAYFDYGEGVTSGRTGFKYAYVYAIISKGKALPQGGITFYPMLEAGEVQHAYQSTHGGSGALSNRIKLAETSITQTAEQIELKATELESEILGEITALNMLPSVYYTENRRSNPHVSAGITWTLNPDGSVTATGTASADENSVYSFCGGTTDADIPVIRIDPSKKYTISGCPPGGSANDYRLVARLYPENTNPDNFNNGTTVTDYGNGNTSSTTGFKYAYVYAIITKGKTLPQNGITFSPMFESGSTKHAYQGTHGSSVLVERVRLAETSITETAAQITLLATKTEAESYASAVANQIGLRNLLPPLYYTENKRSNPYVSSGVTWTLGSDGTINAKGTATGANSLYHFCGGVFTEDGEPTPVPLIPLDPTKKYTLSGCPSGGGSGKYRLIMFLYKSTETPDWYNAGHPFYDTGDGVTSDTGYSYAYVYAAAYKDFALPNSGITFKPMLEAGETKHAYQSSHIGTGALTSRVTSAEAELIVQAGKIASKVTQSDVETYTTNYVDGRLSNYSTTQQMNSAIEQAANSITSTVSSTYIEKTEVTTLNLLPSIYYTENLRVNKTVTANGITWTLNNDGSVTATGTATANSSYSFSGSTRDADVPLIVIDPDKKYTLSGCPSGGGDPGYHLTMRLYDSNVSSYQGYTDIGNGRTSSTGYTYAYVYAIVNSGVALPSSGITFKPMLEVGSTKHAYQSTHVGSGIVLERIKSAESSITQTATEIESKVSTTDFTGVTIASKINQSASSVIIEANHISLSGKTINLTSDNIDISSTNFSVTSAGALTATSGTIAGWNISSTMFSRTFSASDGYDYQAFIQIGSAATTRAFGVQTKLTSADSYASSGYQFHVRYDGKLFARNADITGAITATSLNISNATITGTISASNIDATNLHVQGANIDNLTVGKINGATANANSASSYLQIGSWQAYGPAGSITFGQLNATNWVRFVPNGKLVYEYGHSGSAAYGHTAYILTYDGTYYRGLCDSGTFYRLAIDW